MSMLQIRIFSHHSINQFPAEVATIDKRGTTFWDRTVGGADLSAEMQSKSMLKSWYEAVIIVWPL